MKKILITTLFFTSLIVMPTVVSAHTNGPDMPMMNTQDGEVSQTEFDEVQGVMIKMMNGEQLTDAETSQLTAFMQAHHSGWEHMMSFGSGMVGSSGGHMFDGTGNFSVLSWIYLLMLVVWLLVGLLLVVVLMRRLYHE